MVANVAHTHARRTGREVMQDKPKLVHRDDIDMEAMQAIEKMLKEKYPGMAVVCAGDLSEGRITQDLQDKIESLQMAFAESMAFGKCIDCGTVMPNYDGLESDENWQPAKGWVWFENPDGSPQSWQCPECDAKENT